MKYSSPRTDLNGIVDGFIEDINDDDAEKVWKSGNQIFILFSAIVLYNMYWCIVGTRLDGMYQSILYEFIERIK